VDVGSVEEFTVVLVDDSMDFLMLNNRIVFTLQGLMKHHPKTKFVIIDMGAVGFIIKGADVMAPGIIDADNTIQKMMLSGFAMRNITNHSPQDCIDEWGGNEVKKNRGKL